MARAVVGALAATSTARATYVVHAFRPLTVHFNPSAAMPSSPTRVQEYRSRPFCTEVPQTKRGGCHPNGTGVCWGMRGQEGKNKLRAASLFMTRARKRCEKLGRRHGTFCEWFAALPPPNQHRTERAMGLWAIPPHLADVYQDLVALWSSRHLQHQLTHVGIHKSGAGNCKARKNTHTTTTTTPTTLNSTTLAAGTRKS